MPEAIIVAKDDNEAESLVYANHNPCRGTVRHWTWRELPTITNEKKKDSP